MPEKPRVLLLEGSLAHGGMTTHLKALGEGLMARGWDVAVASAGKVSEECYEPAFFEAQGMRHFHVPFPEGLFSFGLRNPLQMMRVMRRLRSVVRQYRPALMHVHFYTLHPYVWVVGRLEAVPYVSTLHVSETPWFYQEDAPKRHRLYRLLCPWGQRTIAISSDIRSFMLERIGLPEAQVRTVFNGVDATYFRPPSTAERQEARQAFGLKPKDVAVCCVARLDPSKGQDVLMRAMMYLKRRGVKPVVLLAGDGDRRWVEHLVARAEVTDRVRLLGYVEVRTVYWASDFSVLPSRWEGSPLTTAEAMHCGLTQIRTQTSGATDQIESGVDGAIVPMNRPQALAEWMERLIQDEALRARMSAAAVEKARCRLTLDRMVEETVAVYRSVL